MLCFSIFPSNPFSFHLSKRTQKQDGRGHFGCVGYNEKRKGEGGGSFEGCSNLEWGNVRSNTSALAHFRFFQFARRSCLFNIERKF